MGLIQGGGVVFRNMGTATQNPGYTNEESKDRYYVDKYIGRVLDGYAINEVETDASVTFAAGTNTDGTPKNYSIPNISSPKCIGRPKRNPRAFSNHPAFLSCHNARLTETGFKSQASKNHI